MSHGQEILGPPLGSREQAEPLIRDAIIHFREAKRATIQVMADLRRLQDGQVHVLYGYANFSKWAEDNFQGLAAGNVRQLCRAGAIALELDRRGLIDLRNPQGVGTTGLRELSTVAGTYGDNKMAEVFVTAKGMIEPDAEVSGTTVESAMRLLMPPADMDVVEKTDDLTKSTDAEELEDSDDEEYPPKVNELLDRIRDLSWEIPDDEPMSELIQTILQLKRELKGKVSDADQEWLDSSR
jgi:hypothetical protein